MNESIILPETKPKQNKLNEINLELGPKTQTMMQIDNNNSYEKAFCLILVLVITLITVVASINLRSHDHINSTVIKISQDNNNEIKTESSLSNISPFNRFSSIQIIFRRAVASTEIKSSIFVCFQIFSEDYDKVSSIHFFSQKFYNVTFKKSYIESDPLKIFSDITISSKEYKLFLNISGQPIKSFSYLEIQWVYGDVKITYAFIMIRTLYMFVMIILFIIYTKLMFRYRFQAWTYEQKLTYFLIILCFFSDYPLNNIFFGQTSQIIHIFSLFFNSLFQSYLLFYITSIFQCLKSQFTSADRRIRIYALSFFSFATLCDTIITIAIYVNFFRSHFPLKNNYFFYFPVCIELLLSLITIIIIVIISAYLDETEFLRFITYSVHTFLMLIVIIPSKILKNENQFSYIASTIEVTGYNLFVIAMCYFHWTYAFKENTSYQDSSIQENKEDIMIDMFSDNVITPLAKRFESDEFNSSENTKE